MNDKDKQELADRFIDLWAGSPEQKIAMREDLETLKAEWQREAITKTVDLLRKRRGLSKKEWLHGVGVDIYNPTEEQYQAGLVLHVSDLLYSISKEDGDE